MKKTTVYLPDELKERIEEQARHDGISEAEVIRRTLEASVTHHRPRPRGGMLHSSEPIADRVDELLAGFGEN